MANIFDEISINLQKGENDKVSALTQQAVNEKIPPKEILNKGLLAGMDIIGEQYKNHEIFLPQVLLAAKAMYAGMDILRPLFIGDTMPTVGKIVIGTVYGDLHDIGKNLVGTMLKGAGFEVIDLGNNVPAEKFIETAIAEDAPLIGLSALLTTTMPVMGRIVELREEKGLSNKIKIIVGGASLSEEFADKIGADAYCYDSTNAVEVAKQFIKN
jgi:5-methyltetrahydrofolate--homocysteine methyltransferase